MITERVEPPARGRWGRICSFPWWQRVAMARASTNMEPATKQRLRTEWHRRIRGDYNDAISTAFSSITMRQILPRAPARRHDFLVRAQQRRANTPRRTRDTAKPQTIKRKTNPTGAIKHGAVQETAIFVSTLMPVAQRIHGSA